MLAVGGNCRRLNPQSPVNASQYLFSPIADDIGDSEQGPFNLEQLLLRRPIDGFVADEHFFLRIIWTAMMGH